MRTPKHDTEPTRTDDLRRLSSAITELQRQRCDALGMPHVTDAEHAIRAARLALIAIRMSAWWGLVSKKAYRDGHHLYGRAAVIAVHTEKDNARFWRDAAADWQARAEHRPTSDAAGALSNWHELGVTA